MTRLPTDFEVHPKGTAERIRRLEELLAAVRAARRCDDSTLVAAAARLDSALSELGE